MNSRLLGAVSICVFSLGLADASYAQTSGYDAEASHTDPEGAV